MIFLSYDKNAFRAEYFLGAVNAFIRGKSGMIAEDRILVDTRFNGNALHRIHLVVIAPAVIARHEQTRRSTAVIKLDTRLYAVAQHIGRRTVGAHACAEHENAIKAAAFFRFIGGDHTTFAGRLHGSAERKHRNSRHSGKKQTDRDDRNHYFPHPRFAGTLFPLLHEVTSFVFIFMI